MTVESQEEVATEVIEEVFESSKGDRDVAEEMYGDKSKVEDVKTDEVKEEVEDKSKEEEDPEKGAEDAGEQEETKDGEDTVTLTLSKDSPLDEGALNDVLEFAKEQGLSQEQAQAQLEREESANASFVEKQATDLEASVADWTKQIEEHAVYGGEKLKAATLIANKPLIKFGSEGVNKFLETTGLSNHPDTFDLFYNIGLAMGDDQFIKGQAPVVKVKTTRAQRMYPDNVKKE